MAYWLVKSDPSEYSWDQLVQDGEADWTGVRNFQARKFLNEMAVGDPVLVYHTEDDKEIVGIAEVTAAAKQDPTDEEGKWVSVRLKAIKPVGRTLDFLSQEMLREANTIASKSPDAGISRAIVEVKGAIDRIKEQVQNVE